MKFPKKISCCFGIQETSIRASRALSQAIGKNKKSPQKPKEKDSSSECAHEEENNALTGEIVTFEQSQVILNEGDDQDMAVYLLQSGKLTGAEDIATGDVITPIESYFDLPVSETIKAETEVKLMKLEAETVSVTMRNQDTCFKLLTHFLSSDCNIFKDISEGSLTPLVKNARMMFFDINEEIETKAICSGLSASGTLFILWKGECAKISVEEEKEGFKNMTVRDTHIYKRGTALRLDSESSNLIALRNCYFLCSPVALLPEEASLEIQAEKIRRKLCVSRLRGVAQFKDMSQNDLTHFAEIAQIRQINSDIISFNQIPFVVVIQGSLLVREREHPDRTLEAGSECGLHELLFSKVSETPSVFVVSASEESENGCLIATWSKQDFDEFFVDKRELIACIRLRCQALKPKLTDILDKESSFKLFRQFCGGEHTVENPDFYNALKKVHDKHSMIRRLADSLEIECVKKEVKEELREIFQTFIKQTASTQVNISSNVRTKLEEQFKNSELEVESFKDALSEISDLMLRDSFPRFKKTNLYDLASGRRTNVLSPKTLMQEELLRKKKQES